MVTFRAGMQSVCRRGYNLVHGFAALTLIAAMGLVVLQHSQPTLALPTWTEAQPAGNTDQKWSMSSISADGQTLLVGTVDNSSGVPTQRGRLYISTDRGANWTETQPLGNSVVSWLSSSMSADGQTMLVAADTGRLYLTTDGGANWNETQPAGNTDHGWPTTSMSADGQTMIAVSNNFDGSVYVSYNGGTSWTETEPAGSSDYDWWLGRVSADGQTMMAGQRGGGQPGRLYLSTNAGASWAETQPAGNVDLAWQTGDISADGQVITAGVFEYAGQGIFGAFYVSTDGGTNWTYSPPTGGGGSIGEESPSSAAMSADGQTIMVGMEDGRLFISEDAGGTWTETDPFGTASNQSWGTVSMSADGETTMLAGSLVTRLWLGTPPPPPPTFSGAGSGTAGDPYQITSCALLQEMAGLPTDYYALMNDVDCTGFPYTSVNGFSGSLDGNEHRIINLESASGLFEFASGATVTDLTFTGGSVNGSFGVGPLGGVLASTTVVNVHSDQPVTSDSSCVGGLIGYMDGTSTVTRSSASGDVIAEDDAGGFVGCVSDSSIEQSYATGSVTEGPLSQDGIEFGGFVGYAADAVITDAYARGDVDVGNGEAVGGFVGTNDNSTFTNTYVASILTVAATPDDPGGFSGENNGTVVAAFWDSTVGGSWLSCGTGSSGCTGILDRPTAQMKTLSTFTTDLGADAWDFATIWALDSTTNDGYPFLAWQGSPPASPPPSQPPAAPAGSPGGGAASIPPFTASETPAKTLALDVNLSDGQAIAGTYEIIVTPQAANTGSYDRVEFYVDDTLTATFYPSADGVARTVWDTNRAPGTHLRLVVYDGQSVALTWNFTVSMARSPAWEQPQPAAPQPDPHTTDRWLWVRFVPPRVAFTIPYLLLFLLVLLTVMLLYQAHREAMAARRLDRAYRRAKQLAEEKEGFVALISHYLRTPLTIMQGSVSLPGKQDKTTAALSATVAHFSKLAEGLILGVEQSTALRTIDQSPYLTPPKKAVHTAFFWVPLAAIGAILVLWNVVFALARIQAFNALNILTQLMIFVMAAAGMYIAVRNLLVARRDRKTGIEQAAQQEALDTARNAFILESASQLSVPLAGINTIANELPEGPQRKFLLEGHERLAGILDRFRAVAAVTPVQESVPFTVLAAGDLLTDETVPAVVREKHITLRTGPEDRFATQQPAWLKSIVGSMLSNAAAHSPEGSQVEVGVQQHGKTATLTVSDRGDGIAQDKLDMLFQPFSKVEGPTQFDYPGLGLSLYMDRLLATSLGGTMSINSSPGNGTSVAVSFPSKPA